MGEPGFIPLPLFPSYTHDEMTQRAAEFLTLMRSRRSVRQFSDQPVPYQVIADCLRTAATAPSGANQQPWHFVVVSDRDVKRQIRSAAEAEEREFYAHRATPEWLAALEPLGTDEHKPYLEIAPYLIAVFVQTYGVHPDGSRKKHYYALESVGIATGILITALHQAGLATLTHTPSPMNFMNKILQRPPHEKPFVLLVTGYPAEEARVPQITKKPFQEIVTFL